MFDVRLHLAIMQSAVFTSVMAAGEVMTYSITEYVTFLFDENDSFKILFINAFTSKLIYALLMYILFHISKKIKNIDVGKDLDKISL